MRDRKESDRRYHQRHKAERNAASLAWDKAHPERARERQRRYRAKLRAEARAEAAALERLAGEGREMVLQFRQEIREMERRACVVPLTKAEERALFKLLNMLEDDQ